MIKFVSDFYSTSFCMVVSPLDMVCVRVYVCVFVYPIIDLRCYCPYRAETSWIQDRFSLLSSSNIRALSCLSTIFQVPFFLTYFTFNHCRLRYVHAVYLFVTRRHSPNTNVTPICEMIFYKLNVELLSCLQMACLILYKGVTRSKLVVVND